jgi:hypothetical protein
MSICEPFTVRSNHCPNHCILIYVLQICDVISKKRSMTMIFLKRKTTKNFSYLHSVGGAMDCAYPIPYICKKGALKKQLRYNNSCIYNTIII